MRKLYWGSAGVCSFGVWCRFITPCIIALNSCEPNGLVYLKGMKMHKHERWYRDGLNDKLAEIKPPEEERKSPTLWGIVFFMLSVGIWFCVWHLLNAVLA